MRSWSNQSALALLVVLGVISLLPLRAPAGDKATLADFAWLEGRWEGKLGTSTTEIVYSAPSADGIMGMFRLVEGDRTVMLEFLALRQTAEGIEMLVRHFDPALAPMEKEDALILKLASHNDTEAVFENLVHTRPKTARYVRVGPDTHIARSLVINDKGEERTIEVTWHRSTEGTPTATGVVPADPLAPLTPLVGRWRGQIKLVNGGTIEALNVWEWGNKRKTVHFRAYGLVEGRENLFYEGFYYWHPGQQKIVFREVARDGSLNEGSIAAEGDTLRLEWTGYESEGQTQFREVFRFPDPDHYVSRAEKKNANGWEPATNENSFTREAAASAQTATPGEPGARVLSKEVVLEAPLAEVWKAWTTTEGVETFFGPRANIEATPGGPYEIYFNLGLPEGLRGSEGCKVHTVVPMKLLAFEWNQPPSIPTLRDVHTLVFLRFEELAPNQVRVVMTHAGWGAGEEWDKAYTYFDHAWDAVLGNLRYRFAVGPVDWPGGTFRVAQLPAKAN